jgi:hypothetical protein
MSHLEGKTTALKKSAEQAYDWSITVRDYFDRVLEDIPVEQNKELHEKIMVLRNEAENAISATWEAKHAVELTIEAIEEQER